MAGKEDGIIYYCRLPDHAGQSGSVIARKMLKRGFAEFFHTDFTETSIGRSENGKPYYKENGKLQFNISHCRKMVTVGVSYLPLGIDAENMRGVNARTVRKCCCKEELFYVFAGREGVSGKECLSETEIMRFLYLWTLKESYVKLTGEGLSRPFHTVNFNISGLKLSEGRELKEVMGDDAGIRHFLYPMGEIALALSARAGENVRFTWKEIDFEDI